MTAPIEFEDVRARTTAIRAAVGLLQGAVGRIRLLGADVPRGLASTIDRVGALVEQPPFFPAFTGRRNLELLGRTRGIGARRVALLLDRVLRSVSPPVPPRPEEDAVRSGTTLVVIWLVLIVAGSGAVFARAEVR